MKLSEWIAILGLILSFSAGAFAGWLQLETRLAGLERAQDNNLMAQQIVRHEVLELIKLVSRLRGCPTERIDSE